VAKKKQSDPKEETAAQDAPPSGEEFPEVMTVKQAAAYLQVNEQVLYRYVREDKVPVARMGATIRFKKSVLDRWLESESWNSIGMEPKSDGEVIRRFKPSRPSLPMELD
jgi:excisionase family DNA binding protein